jgi:formylglycine-generating enzyme required for sulfatase activity
MTRRNTSLGFPGSPEGLIEYAARAGATTAYPWGDYIWPNHTAMANCEGCDNQYDAKTAPAGSFAANAFGLYDMVGNVWEWTEDCWHDDYEGAPVDGSSWTGGNCRSLSLLGGSLTVAPVNIRAKRGGSLNALPLEVRSATRKWDLDTSRYPDTGFRVARTLGADSLLKKP